MIISCFTVTVESQFIVHSITILVQFSIDFLSYAEVMLKTQ